MNLFKTTFALATLLTGWTVLASPTSAKPIYYDEAVDGDLKSTYFAPPSFTLGIGENVFTGTTKIRNRYFSSDFDSFDFTVPENTFVESISFDLEVLSGGSGNFHQINYSLGKSPLSPGPFHEPMRQTIRIPKEMGQIKDKPLFKAILPLASGDYRWDHLGLSGSSNYNEKLSRDAKYHISLNVVSESEPEPIPEPTVFWGLVAIAGLGLTLRRSPQHP